MRAGRLAATFFAALIVHVAIPASPGRVLLPDLVGAIAVAASGASTLRVSVSGSGEQGNAGSNFGSASRDGAVIVFTSSASNLVPGDTNGFRDVFTFERATGVVSRVSLGPEGLQANGASGLAAISGDGRWIAFASEASDLVPGDTNGVRDVFLFDRVARTTSRISLTSTGGQASGRSDVFNGAISFDGRYVGFNSFADLTGAGGSVPSGSAYLYDRLLGTVRPVCITTAGTETRGCFGTSQSDDGRHVGFESDGAGLVAGDTNGVRDVFVRDMVEGRTTRVSVSSSGGQGNFRSCAAALTPDARFVAFHSLATNLVDGDTNFQFDVFVRDLAGGTTERVSLGSGGVQGNGESRLGFQGCGGGGGRAISADGRFVAFMSFASNLVAGDTNGRVDVFVVDRSTAVMERVSVNGDGTQGNGDSLNVEITGDGGLVVFESFASNLVDGDTNGSADIFLRNWRDTGDFGSDKPYAFGLHAMGAFSRDPINLATGSFTAQADDLVLPGRVLGLAFTRWYNSADTTTGPLGPAWTHTYNWRVTDGGPTVEVRRGDGRRDTFTRNPDGTYANPPDTFDVLAKNADGTYSLTLTSQVRYEFSSAGAPTAIREPAGNAITLTYTAGNLTTITDTVGRAVTLSYDAANRLTALQDPLGRRVTYAYDATGRLITVVDRIGNAAGQDANLHRWQYAYDGTTAHLTAITDPDGRVRVRNTYDAQGRVIEQRDGLGALTTIAYGSGQTTITDPRGHPTTYTFDARMRVLTQTDVVGSSTYVISYTYDAAGNRTSVTDRNGNRTDLSYDARGNVLTKTDPAPSAGAPRPLTSFSYHAQNNLTRIVDPLGFATELAYDGATNVLRSVRRQIDAATWATTTYDYADPANPGLPTRVTAPRGNTGPIPDPTYATTLAYDAQGNLVWRTDPDGARTTFAYDAAGRLTSFVDPDGNAPGGVPAEHTWAIAYDANDRETSRTDPLGNVLRYGYDGAGNRTSLTDRNGNVTAYAYDANARLAFVQQRPDLVGQPALAYVTTVTRDFDGNATRIAQANGVGTDYAFDALDRLTSVTTHPDASTDLVTTYVLDGNGQPTSRTTGDGVTVAYAYDGLSRLTSVSGPSLAITYEYDASGRRTRMTDATGITTYQYDGLGRVTQVAAPGATLAYGYDLDGDRTTLGYPGGETVTYAYSSGGRMTTVTDWAGRTSTYTYRPSGLVASLAYPNGLTATYAYDRAQRLTSLSYVRGDVIVAQDLALDAEGNRIAITEAVRGMAATAATLRYDGLDRLTSLERRLANGTPLSNETFTLDPATNLTTRTDPAASYSYDGANRLLGDGARAFSWDGADRLVGRGADTFAYDALARLSSSTIGGITRTYAYDGDGLLRSRTDGAATTSFLWDLSLAPAPLVVAGADRIVHGLGPLYRARADGSFDAFARDSLGSVRAEVSGGGRVSNAYDYAAYGALRASLAGPPLLGFAGELTDPSGLIYLRARWYDPGLGRFTVRDPYAGTVGVPSSLNLYSYVAGRPTLLTDPLGLDPESSDLGDAGVGCQKFFFCHVRPVPSAEAQPIVLVPVRGPFGYGVISFARGSESGKHRSPGASANAPPPPPGVTKRTLSKVERQLVEHGVDSLRRSEKSLLRRIAEHNVKIADAQATSGFTSSMETEIRAFEGELEAIRWVLRQGPQ